MFLQRGAPLLAKPKGTNSWAATNTVKQGHTIWLTFGWAGCGVPLPFSQWGFAMGSHGCWTGCGCSQQGWGVHHGCKAAPTCMLQPGPAAPPALAQGSSDRKLASHWSDVSIKQRLFLWKKIIYYSLSESFTVILWIIIWIWPCLEAYFSSELPAGPKFSASTALRSLHPNPKLFIPTLLLPSIDLKMFLMPSLNLPCLLSASQKWFLSGIRFKEPALQQSHSALLCQNPNDDLYILKRLSPAVKLKSFWGSIQFPDLRPIFIFWSWG